MRKPNTENRYHNPVRSIFNKKRNKSKGGGQTLQERAEDMEVNEITYSAPKGLTSDEWKTAMHEIRKGYSWKDSSIEPKDDEAKRYDFEELRKSI